MREFVFWQDALSLHQSAFLRNLATCNGTKVTLVVWEDINARRKAWGWPRPDFGRTRVFIKPSPEIQEDLLRCERDRVQVFSGPRGHPFVNAALRRNLGSSGFIGMMSEAHDKRGLKGGLRFLRSVWDERCLGNRVDMILAIGREAVAWYVGCGYPVDKIVPFGYFVESPELEDVDRPPDDEGNRFFEMVFVGELAPWKGWDLLLRALCGLTGPKWLLHVIGDGVDKKRALALCRQLGLSGRVRFHGILPNKEVLYNISRSDLLVLPSRWDGWGAVINEALMCGVPVVCSDRCGAKDLLDGGVRGEVVPSNSIAALREALQRRASRGRPDPTARRMIRTWAQCISGTAAANYFLAVTEALRCGGPKPVPPWLRIEP